MTPVGTAILGAGFSGLGMAIELARRGDRDFRILERENGAGGTWWLNRYPGCACDVPAHLYSFSFAPWPGWSRRYAPRGEIQAYLQALFESWALDHHTRFGTEVTAMEWHPSPGLWEIRAGDGRRWHARRVVLAAGGLARPAWPEIPGLDTFRGRAFHSQQWPSGEPLEDRRVAVIGTGASAIQFIPEIQPRVRALHVYQRSAPWVLPRRDRPVPGWRRRLYGRLPGLQRLVRWGIYWRLEPRVLGLVHHPALSFLHRSLARRHLKKQVPDPALRARLAPEHEMGCKRVLLSDDYYPAMTGGNVELVTEGIRRVTPDGILDDSGSLRRADTLIAATGFQATRPLPPGLVRGRDGLDLAQAWQDGPVAYKGTTVSGFPNLFVLLGPNTALGHSSVLLMLESQLQYVGQALAWLDRNPDRALEVRPGAQKDWNRRLQARLSTSVWNRGGCSSWYLHPETGHNATVWPGFTWQFRRGLRRFDPKAYLRPRIGRERAVSNA